MRIWNPADPVVVDAIRSLWNDGKSASEIAAEFDGATRNAVIGKVHRMGLMRSTSAVQESIRSKATLRAPRAAQPKAPKVPKAVKTAPRGAPAVAVDIANARPWAERTRLQCAFLLDDGRACCAGVRTGSSYCAGHHALIYRPTSSAAELARSLRKYA